MIKNIKGYFITILIILSVCNFNFIKGSNVIHESVIDSNNAKTNQFYVQDTSIVNIQEVKASKDGKLFIKRYEKLELKAYIIDSNMITIGYGHSTLRTDSLFKMGDIISVSEAESLFNKDIRHAEQIVRNVLLSWGEGVEITQGMFDAMVSMAYNMGIYGFQKAKFLIDLKNKDYWIAAEKIKTTSVSVRYPGLYIRRIGEYDLFTKNLIVF